MTGMPFEVIDDIALFDATIAMFAIESRKALAEVTIEDILERGARVL